MTKVNKQIISNVASQLALLAFAMLVTPAAHAYEVFTVNTVADLIDNNTSDGSCRTSTDTCSLRAAIMQANHMSGSDLTVVSVPAGTYLLTIPVSNNGFDGEDTGDLNLTTPLTPGHIIVIIGAGATGTIIDANHIDSAINVDSDRTAIIGGVTIRNGHTLFYGGGITNRGTLTITHCVIENNFAKGGGGGVDNFFGVLNIVGSTIRGNISDGDGGGVDTSGLITIRDSTLSDNSADNGGGIYNLGQMYVVSSTISRNTTNTNGGGIYNSIDASLYNTSVLENIADLDHDENGGVGGGVYEEEGFGAHFVAFNSLIAGNASNAGYNDDDCRGTLELYGVSLFGTMTGCTFTGYGAASRGFVALNTIGPLQDNGGPTLTHALLPGSQAINGTNDNERCTDQIGTHLTTDQRGLPRVAGARCDVGAFEYGAVAPNDLIFSNGFD